MKQLPIAVRSAKRTNRLASDAINDSGVSQTYEVSEELHNEMVQACTDAGIYDLVIEKAGGTYAEDLWAAAGFTPAA